MALPLFLVEAPGGGRLGITPMPGHGVGLREDLARIRSAGGSVLLSMTPRSEWAGDLEAATRESKITLHHLPIRDWGVPPPDTNAKWPEAAGVAHRALDQGETVFAHCMGGRGRSGTAVMRLLVERGMEPDDALLRIRMVRPGAVETDPQRSWAADVHTEISRDTSKIDWNDVHSLLHGAFAYMEDRIAPPSSLLRMSPEDLKAKAETGFFWSAGRGARLAGCLFGSTQGNALYLGKLAVRSELRGRGIARALIEAAQDVGRLQGQTRLRLDSRVELTETHKAFTMLGFEETGRTAHPGFERPTSIVFERPI